MPIKYSCVNEGKELLADFPNDEQPQLAETMQKVIATISAKEYRRKILEDNEGGVNYSYISNGEGRIVACVTTSDMPMRMIFAFLESVEPLVRGSVGPHGTELRNGKKLLQQKMEFYNNPKNDKLTFLNNELSQVMDVMMDNIDKVLVRNEHLDTLDHKTANLANQAQEFQQSSTELKRNLCMKNIKLTLIIIAAVLVFILIILMIVCKPNFSRCS